jgi:hypothetical protein
MKQLLISLVLASTLLISCTESTDPEEEKNRIISVIEEERNAYFDGEISRLEAVWIQNSESQRIFRSTDTMLILNGWSEILNNYQESLEAEWRSDSGNLFADFTNYKINLYENSALLIFDIGWTGSVKDVKVDTKQKGIAHFVKEEGAWKIDFTTQITLP